MNASTDTEIDSKNSLSEKTTKKQKSGLFSKWIPLAILLFITFNSFTIVQEGSTGVNKRLGIAKTLFPPGLHFKIPFVDSVEILETRIRILKLKTQAISADKLNIRLELVANWQLPSNAVRKFYPQYGTPTQYEERRLSPLLKSITHGLISQYTSSELLEKRIKIAQLISNSISNIMGTPSALLNDVQIEKIILPPSYQKALEEKLVQQQILENERLKVSKEKIRAQAEFDIAEIRAESLIKQSESKAKSSLIEGDAKVAVIKKVINAMQDSRTYVQYEKIQKWDGKISTTIANPNDIFKSIEK